MINQTLTDARKKKNDEFYTRWEDIEKEINSYLEYNPDTFRGKTILLPADDPFESEFFKFFATHFNDYELKKIIATSYDPSPIVNTQLELSLFEDSTDLVQRKFRKTNKAYKIELTDVSDFDSNGIVNISDVEKLLLNEKHKIDMGGKSCILTYLEGDRNPDNESRFSPGDFRSQEVTKLKDESDIIITNPPFSLFRSFLKWVNPTEKQFILLGNMNAITYREIFPLLRDNIIWLGNRLLNKDMYFNVPDNQRQWLVANKKEGSAYKIVNGIVMGRLANACWFTNIDHGRRHQFLQLMTMTDNLKFSKHKTLRNSTYNHYDNFKAIDVPFVDAIPRDFKGIMGVPITFLGKYNPDQFTIIGITNHGDMAGIPFKGKNSYAEINGKRNYVRVLIKKKE